MTRTKPTPNSALSEIQTQILWNRLIAIVEEQAQTLIRTAFSSTVREAGDLSAGVFDLKGRMLAQAVTGTPGHVNAMAVSVTHFLDKYSPSTMRPGDVFITNDPWLATGHLHDFTVVTPAFHDGQMVALFASTCHVVDVGGLGFGPDGRQVYEEGLYVPIIPLFKEGVINETLLEIMRANVREPVQVEGDFHSLAACNQIGCDRLDRMLDEFALSDLVGLDDTIVSRSHQAMLEALRALPHGTYHNRMRVDGYDQPVDMVATMTIGDDGMTIDFTGTSGMSDHGINVPLSYTQAYATFGVRCVVGGSIPNNDGSLSAIRVTAPEGCILNAPHPRAVAARHAMGQMLPDVVLGCLHQAVDAIAPAEGTSCLWNFVLYGGGGFSGAEADDEPFTVTLFHNGGTGARADGDGLSATAFPSGVRNMPVEIDEAIAPILITQKEYRTDSGGAGQHRGGLGQAMDIRHRDGKPFVISSMFDRVDYPPRGRAEGGPGATGAIALEAGGALNAKGRQTVPAGDTLTLRMPGGGGYGPAHARDPEKVALDVRDELISPAAARTLYGVVLSDDGQVDDAATRKTRDRLSSA